MTRILITSVQGKTGAPLAERLAARDNAEVLGGSRDPSGVAGGPRGSRERAQLDRVAPELVYAGLDRLPNANRGA